MRTRANIPDATLKAELCRLAYLQSTGRASRLAALGLRETASFHDSTTNADGFLVEDDQRAVVVFRGTEKNYGDILTDLRFRAAAYHSPSRSYSGEAVHRGFLAQWLGIRSGIRKALRDVTRAGKAVSATGHSLGGALAVLMAADNMTSGDLVTFGCPRVGNRAFARTIADAIPHHRYVLGADIVPVVPLMSLGFQHGSPAHYIDAEARTITANASIWPEMWGRARSLFTFDWTTGRFGCPAPLRMFTDHKIDDYIKALRELDHG